MKYRSESREQVRAERIVHCFGDHEGPAARASYKTYFDKLRAVQGKRPMQLVEIDGCWLAVEVDEGNAIDKSCNRNDTDTRAEG